jgi:hypothetical protein
MIDHPGRGVRGLYSQDRMTVFRRLLTVAIAGAASIAVAAAAQDKKDKAEGQIPTADLTPVWVVMDHAMDGTGGIQSGYGTSTYDVSSGATATDLKVEPVAAEESPTLEFRNDFIKGQEGKIYMPFQLLVNRDKVAAKSLVLSTRMAPKGAMGPDAPAAPAAPAEKGKNAKAAAPHSRYKWEDSWVIDLPSGPSTAKAYKVTGALSIEPGDYDLYVGIRQRSGDAAPAKTPAQKAAAENAPATTPEAGSKARVTVFKKELVVPALGDELTTSSVIVADKVDVLQAAIAPDKQRENPYTFGQMKITPSETNKFAKTDDLNIVFWIYGAQVDSATKKPNVSVDYSFSQKTASGEKYFNKTDPQELNATTLPPQFDLAAGHQLPGSLQVPLASFPEGDYHLEIKVADKVSGKSITRDVMFTVAPQVQ